MPRTHVDRCFVAIVPPSPLPVLEGFNSITTGGREGEKSYSYEPHCNGKTLTSAPPFVFDADRFRLPSSHVMESDT